jgi:AmmeMemoRadiSam system protein A
MNAATVRPFEECDRDPLLALARGLGEWFTPEGLDHMGTDLHFQRTLVAEQDGEPVGFVTYFTDEAVGRIGWMGVRAGVHRRGVGRGLIAALDGIFAGTGVREIRVMTLGDSVDYEPYARTRAFYRAVGFTDFSRTMTDNPSCPEQLVLARPVGLALTEADRSALLALARRTLETHLGGDDGGDHDVPSSQAMQSTHGAFVSIYIDDALRGCRGRIVTSDPLRTTIAEETLASALEDHRFAPVRADELHRARLSISVLGAPWDVSGQDAIELGRHGIILCKGQHRAVFLPQVPTEYGWDLPTTLSRLAHKAGLPPDGWSTGATFQVFEADVFGE